MKHFILLVLFLISACASGPKTIDEARANFYETMMEVSQSEDCVPPKLEKAFRQLERLVFARADSLEAQEQFIGQDTQEYDRWESLCQPRRL